MYQTDPNSITACHGTTETTHRVRLNIGSVGYDHKPTKKEIATIVADMATAETQHELTLQELMYLVASQGHPFTPALLSTPKSDGTVSKCNECFTSQQVFALDFDNEKAEVVTLDDTLQRAGELDLVPFGAYYTPSSIAERPKYRLLFCMDRFAINRRDRQVVIEMLLELFPAADPSCKDAARHFNGVMTGAVEDDRIDPAAVNSIAALTLAWQAEVARDKAHGSDKIKRFADRHGLELQGHRLVVAPPLNFKCGETRATSIYTLELPANSPFCNANETVRGATLFCNTPAANPPGSDCVAVSVPKPVEPIRWDRVKDQLMECPLMQTLFRNSQPVPPLSHGEFFHLATHFINLRGADQVFEDALERTGHNEGRRIGQYRQMSLAYRPQRCENSACRHKESCCFLRMPDHKNIFSIRFARGQVRQTQATQTISLDEARKLMPEYFEQALRSKKKVSIIRADCGAGKTKTMIDCMLDQADAGKKVVYAAPTHRLINETYEALLENAKQGLPIYRWPDLVKHIEDDDAVLADLVKHYWATGHYGTAAKEIFNWAYRQARENGYYMQDRDALDERAVDIKDYLDAKTHQDDADPAVWLVTHARLVYAPIKADIAFIDEDLLLKSLLTVRECKYSDLNRLLSGLRSFSCDRRQDIKERQEALTTADALTKLLQEIWTSSKDQVTPMPSMDFPSASLLHKVLSSRVRFCSDREEPEGEQSDLLEFLTSRTVAFVCPQRGAQKEKIVFVSRRNLPGRIGKYIVASASANRQLYEVFLKEGNIEFLNMVPIAYQGELILHPKKSFANCSLQGEGNKQTREKIQEILQNHPDVPVICSKQLRDSLPVEQQERVVCTFGATEGLNSYQGSDLMVIGALHRPDYVYKLLAVALGQKLGIDTTLELQYRQISRNGYDFHAVAFDNELLQEIQFAMIETELEQAVGRARLVSYDCTVHLYTNIPLLQCRIAS